MFYKNLLMARSVYRDESLISTNDMIVKILKNNDYSEFRAEVKSYSYVFFNGLSLSWENIITKDNVKHFALALPRNVRTLSISTLFSDGREVDFDFFVDFAQCIPPAITCLQIRGIVINDKGAYEFSQKIRASNIETLFLNDNEITLEAAKELIRGLKGSKVEYLSMCGSRISHDTVNELIPILQDANIRIFYIKDNEQIDVPKKLSKDLVVVSSVPLVLNLAPELKFEEKPKIDVAVVNVDNKEILEKTEAIASPIILAENLLNDPKSDSCGSKSNSNSNSQIRVNSSSSLVDIPEINIQLAREELPLEEPAATGLSTYSLSGAFNWAYAKAKNGMNAALGAPSLAINGLAEITASTIVYADDIFFGKAGNKRKSSNDGDREKKITKRN